MIDTRPNNDERLTAAVKAACVSLTSQQTPSVPHCIDAVNHAKGALTKDSVDILYNTRTYFSAVLQFCI